MRKTSPGPQGCGANRAIRRSRPRPWSDQSLRARPSLARFSLATPSALVVLTGPNRSLPPDRRSHAPSLLLFPAILVAGLGAKLPLILMSEFPRPHHYPHPTTSRTDSACLAAEWSSRGGWIPPLENVRRAAHFVRNEFAEDSDAGEPAQIGMDAEPERALDLYLIGQHADQLRVFDCHEEG